MATKKYLKDNPLMFSLTWPAVTLHIHFGYLHSCFMSTVHFVLLLFVFAQMPRTNVHAWALLPPPPSPLNVQSTAPNRYTFWVAVIGDVLFVTSTYCSTELFANGFETIDVF